MMSDKCSFRGSPVKHTEKDNVPLTAEELYALKKKREEQQAGNDSTR